MARRDILLEVNSNSDGSGDYASSFLTTEDIFSVGVVYKCSGGGTLFVEEADSGGNATYVHEANLFGGQAKIMFQPSSAQFRVIHDGTAPGAAVHLSVRAISGSETHGLE